MKKKTRNNIIAATVSSVIVGGLIHLLYRETSSHDTKKSSESYTRTAIQEYTDKLVEEEFRNRDWFFYNLATRKFIRSDRYDDEYNESVKHIVDIMTEYVSPEDALIFVEAAVEHYMKTRQKELDAVYTTSESYKQFHDVTLCEKQSCREILKRMLNDGYELSPTIINQLASMVFTQCPARHPVRYTVEYVKQYIYNMIKLKKELDHNDHKQYFINSNYDIDPCDLKVLDDTMKYMICPEDGEFVIKSCDRGTRFFSYQTLDKAIYIVEDGLLK